MRGRRGSATSRSWGPRGAVGSVLLMLLLLGCGETTDSGGSTDDETTVDRGGPVAPLDTRALLATTWRMRFGGGPDGDVQAVEGSPISITFEGDGTFGGFAGCNEYSGLFQLSDRRLELNGVMVDAAACLEAGVMEAEAAYLAALADVSEVDLGEGQLIMGGMSTELIFLPEPEG